MNTNTKEIRKVLKPVQAGDYGKHAPLPVKDTTPKDTQDTDGRKTLALWS